MSKPTVNPIATLMASPRNPRTISTAAMAGLGESIDRFGDLSGIVWNKRSGHLVAGHQRMAVLKKAGAKSWAQTGDTGEIVHPKTGERFAVRIVDWDETTEMMANLTANNAAISGDFTDTAIEELRAVEIAAGFEALLLDELAAQLSVDLDQVSEDVARERRTLEDFDFAPPPRKAWIMVATTSDRLPEIEAAVRAFEDDDTRVEVSDV